MTPLGFYELVELAIRVTLIATVGALAIRLGRGPRGLVRTVSVVVLAGWTMALVPSLRVDVPTFTYTRDVLTGPPVVAELKEVPLPYEWPRPSLLPWAALVSTAGLLLYGFRVFRTWRTVRQAEHVTDEAAVRWMREASDALGMDHPPVIMLTDQTSSPMATGLWNPVVLVPASLARELDREGWRLVLGHEACHVRRWDLVIQTASSVFAAVFWWVPPVWWVLAEQRVGAEIEVDQEVLKSHPDPVGYANLLVRLRTERPIGLATAWSGFEGLVARLSAMAGPPKPAWIPNACVAGMVLVAVPWSPSARTDLSDALPDRVGVNEVLVVWDINTDARFKAVDPFSGHSRSLFGSGPYPGGGSLSADGRILYGVIPDGKVHTVYAADATGKRLRKVFSTPNGVHTVVPAPDGRHITYSAEVEGWWKIHSYDRYTRAVKDLTPDVYADLHQTFHPNGKRIAFTSNRRGMQSIWSLNTDGTDLRRLTFGPGRDQNPRYSPNGKFLAFNRIDEKDQLNAYWLDIETGAERRIRYGAGNCASPVFIDDRWILADTPTPDGSVLIVFDTLTERSHKIPGTERGSPAGMRPIRPKVVHLPGFNRS